MKSFRLTAPEPSEWDHQVSLVSILRKWRAPDCLFFHVPNQSVGGPARGAFLKRMGALAGVADLCFVHRGRVLFLELKDRTGRPSKAQQEFRNAAQAAGADYALTHRIDESLGLLRGAGILTRALAP